MVDFLFIKLNSTSSQCPVLINPTQIASIEDHKDNKSDINACIGLKNGNFYDVKENIDEIFEQLDKYSEEVSEFE